MSDAFKSVHHLAAALIDAGYICETTARIVNDEAENRKELERLIAVHERNIAAIRSVLGQSGEPKCKSKFRVGDFVQKTYHCGDKAPAFVVIGISGDMIAIWENNEKRNVLEGNLCIAPSAAYLKARGDTIDAR